MNNQKGYILPFVLMLSTLLFFILSHQVSIYITEMKFYQEKKELYEIERMIQKSVIDAYKFLQQEDLQSKELQYEEGEAILLISTESSTLKLITIKIRTKNRRKSTIMLHYDTLTQEIIRWVEGR